MSRRLPLRLRIAIAFTLTMALALVGLGAFVYYRVESVLRSQARTTVNTQLATLIRTPESNRADLMSRMSGESFAQILNTEGDPVLSSPQVESRLVSADRLPEPGRTVTIERRLRLTGENETEPALMMLSREGDQVLVAGTSTDDLAEALAGVRTQLLLGGPLALVVASAAGYLVSGAALRPVERMRERAAAISARSSAERLPLPAARDEIHRLGQTLNAMLDRLDAALRRERRFVAEASHELRTPLGLLRTELDLALARPRSADELLAALHSANEEVDRLITLSEDLLLLADSDQDHLDLQPVTFDLPELLSTIVERFAAMAADTGRDLRVSDGPPLRVHADPVRLDQAISNLVDNALRHGAGNVQLATSQQNGQVSIRVTDHGEGFGAKFREHALGRFTQRGHTPRNGSGLGLAIVEAITTAHHGTLTLANPTPASPTTVIIQIPTHQSDPPR